MQNESNKKRDAKLLEQLVARLERVLSSGLKVTWNGRLPDKTTGGVRQVDVVISEVDTEALVATVECRRRGRVEEIQWIHETIGRRIRLECPRSILVSSTGFSKEAKEIALDEGIELRTFSELATKEQIVSLFPGFKFVLGARHLQVNTSEFRFMPQNPKDASEGSVSLRELDFETVDGPGQRFGYEQFLACLDLNQDEHWQDVPDGSSVDKDYFFWFCPEPLHNLVVDCGEPFRVGIRLISLTPFVQVPLRVHQSSGRLLVHFEGKTFGLGALRLSLTFSQRVQWERLPEKVSSYCGPDGSELTKSAYTTVNEQQGLIWCFHDFGNGKWKAEIVDQNADGPLYFVPDPEV